uniref:Uncharacterized protein n=1 Tax=Scleropages formosus TaxID=113540 RepID=A0A8C9SVD0_SCLFO
QDVRERGDREGGVYKKTSPEHIDLLDTTGELANLSERELSTDPAGSVLRDRHSYVLIRVTRSEGAVGCKYEPLLYDLDKSHPSLAGKAALTAAP